MEKLIYQNSASYRWDQKKVNKEKMICEFSDLKDISKPRNGTIEIEKRLVKRGKNCLKIKANSRVENIYPRPSCGITINFPNSLDLTDYNKVSVYIYPKAVGHINFYFHFAIGNNGFEKVHAPSLKANCWNHVSWEINDVPKDNVTKLTITPFLMGTPPEGEDEVEFYIDSVFVQSVDEEYEEGWDLEERIAYSHIGYVSHSKKVAVVGDRKSDEFSLLKDNQVVYIGKVRPLLSDLGQFYELDFSEVREEGVYKIKYGNIESYNFPIGNDIYRSSIAKSMNFLYSLRCGQYVEGVHSQCHLNCRTVDEHNASVSNFGGWHDAGDLSQFEICTAEMAAAILDLADVLQKNRDPFASRILEEGKVGLEWLLKTTFKDGNRALAVSYSVWRDNILQQDNQSVAISKAENGPFENFCAAVALAIGARVYRDSDSIFADWCLRTAKSDFYFGMEGYKQKIFTKRWGTNVDSQVCGFGILAACELYNLTKDELYKNVALEYADIVLKCQEDKYIDSTNIRGFFYEDVLHQYILTYEHRGHEQCPIQGLIKICETFPNDENFKKWESGILMYKEYIMSTMKYTSPYNILIGHIYNINKLNAERFTIPASYGTIPEGMEILKNQIKEGIKINDEFYIRIFPVAVQRRGFHATLLSKTKAVSLMGKFLKDEKLCQIASDQLEWIFGKNPFSTSTMYGEGYNYHPLYVAFSLQLVGALPVGFRTKGLSDKPYWPIRNNAVYKEVWGHTTGKYLWILADILKKD